MTQEIQWGPAIAVDGKRPGWVKGEDLLRWATEPGDYNWWDRSSMRGYTEEHGINWHGIVEFKLPADHPHYRQTEEAMIDWSGELEAVHEDGRVEPAARLRFGSDATWPDGEGQYHVATDSGVFWNADGTPWGTDRGWRIRNVPQPTPQADTKPDLTARMEALVRKMNETGSLHYAKHCDPLFAEACAIVALLPEPVDEDLVEARKLALQNILWVNPEQRRAVEAGKQDHIPVIKLAYAAIKRGRALALAGEKEA